MDPNQPQTISHLFVTYPVAATVTDWQSCFWQAMTGYLPVASVASLLAADTPSEKLPSDALLLTWHRLRLVLNTVLDNIEAKVALICFCLSFTFYILQETRSGGYKP